MLNAKRKTLNACCCKFGLNYYFRIYKRAANRNTKRKG